MTTTSSSAASTPAQARSPIPTDPPARRRRRTGSLTHPARTGVLLISPAILLVTVFALVPLLFAVYISFTNWPLIGSYHFVGLDNYKIAFTDPVMWQSIRYTLLYTLIVTLPILVLGYVLAVIVRQGRRGATVLRTIFFLPYVVGLTTLSYMMVLEAQPDSGAINKVLKALGFSDGTTAWLVDGKLATIILCALVIWAVPGLTMILLMSAMQGIDQEVYEAAALDGVGWFRRETSITIPIIRPTIIMTLIISITGSLLAFNQFYILTKGGPGMDTMPIVGYIYNRGFVELQLGSATAMSLVLVVVIGLITLIQTLFLRDKD